MRRLMPDPLPDVDPLDLYGHDRRPPHRDRPWVVLNMITSADGATAVGGRSGQLGGPGDHRIFHGMRALCDAVLVGAGTARAENYGPPRLNDEHRERRIAQGQAAVPLLAVVSQSLVFDADARFLVEEPRDVAPCIFTTATSDAGRRADLSRHATVIITGDERVDVAAAVRSLGEHGARVVLCEGGPTLNGDLLAAAVVDELCLTLAPCLASGRSRRAIEGPVLEHPLGMILDRVLEEDGYLFLRYLRPPDSASEPISASSVPSAS